MSFMSAVRTVRSLKISGTKEYQKLYDDGKLPNDLSKYPDVVYKEEWKGWGFYLGNKKEIIIDTILIGKIKFMRKQSISNVKLAEMFGIPYSEISKIK